MGGKIHLVQKGKPGRKPGRPAGTSSDAVSLASLIEARDFADKVGGVENAEQLLRALGKLA